MGRSLRIDLDDTGWVGVKADENYHRLQDKTLIEQLLVGSEVEAAVHDLCLNCFAADYLVQHTKYDERVMNSFSNSNSVMDTSYELEKMKRS